MGEPSDARGFGAACYRPLAAACLAALLGCAPVALREPPEASGPEVIDSEIGAGVAYSFYDAGLPGWQAVEIEVREGQVYLTGHLPSRKAAREAVELALQVPGVRGVISSLVVDG